MCHIHTSLQSNYLKDKVECCKFPEREPVTFGMQVHKQFNMFGVPDILKHKQTTQDNKQTKQNPPQNQQEKNPTKPHQPPKCEYGLKKRAFN